MNWANKITAHNARWPSQFRFAVNVICSGVCEFHRWALTTIIFSAI